MNGKAPKDLSQVPFALLGFLLAYVVLVWFLDVPFPYLLFALAGCVAYARREQLREKRAMKLIAKGKRAEAAKIYDSQIRRGVKLPSAYLNRAHMLMQDDNLPAAMELLQKGLTMEPDPLIEEHIYMTMGMCYWMQGDHDNALETFKGMTERYEKTDGQVTASLGYLYFIKEDYPTAKKWIKMALDEDKHVPIAWESMGQIHYRDGKHIKAEEAFKFAIALQHNMVDSHYHLGLIAEAKNDLERAREHFENAGICDISKMNTVTAEQVKEKLDKFLE
ncbi:MAG: tetratricopeptide repeat protein [Defluviitaleaceae bacterium]|nr:tetratricopeptide repeat protein [Defluviitaleaceae bacterium]